jgi:murein L,D-transpeptidase YafK
MNLSSDADNFHRRKIITLGAIFVIFFLIAVLAYIKFFRDNKTVQVSRAQEAAQLSQASQAQGRGAVPDQEQEQAEQIQAEPEINDSLREGPILYYHPENNPLHLIFIEKASQKLHLYRYDGNYELIKTYQCATGKRLGKKTRENDKKTPEGIYFNIKTYLDSKITIFGDRAFGINYPDVFDQLAGNGGNGIFIHGSNRPVTDFSSNGCVVMKTKDLAEIDNLVEFESSPIILTENMSYRLAGSERDVSELIPFFRQAMIPEQYAQMEAEFDGITVLGFENRVIATGNVTIKNKGKKQLTGVSRLYLADPGKNLLVLIKREWTEKKAAPPKPDNPATKQLREFISSWENAWENKNINEYISKYHSEFVSPDNQNIQEWKYYKQTLNKRYKKISIQIADIKVTIKRKVRACFKQSYKADGYLFKGYKVLELKKEAGDWKILREKSFEEKPDEWEDCEL